MAVQLDLGDLKGCESYFAWLRRLDFGLPGDGSKKSGHAEWELPFDLMQMLFSIDFVCGIDVESDDISDEMKNAIKDDLNRVTDSMELRRRYSMEVGIDQGRSKHDTDRICKSIYGKASALEVITVLCIKLDNMVNEDEKGSMVHLFFRILTENMGLTLFDEEDFDMKKEAIEKYWRGKIQTFLDRKYSFDGSKGGLFPLKSAQKDQREEPLRSQMNAWILENMDEDGHFLRKE